MTSSRRCSRTTAGTTTRGLGYKRVELLSLLLNLHTLKRNGRDREAEYERIIEPAD